MSIEPEVPYEITDDYEDDWRDSTILMDSQSGSDANNARSTVYETMPDRIPDDHWVLPSTNSLSDILGTRRQRLEEIRFSTGTYIEYNQPKHQVDIWGDRVAVEKAKKHLDFLASQAALNHPVKTKTRKWSKPERELTERERQKAERRLARLAEEKSYQGQPPTPQPFTAMFALPDQSVPIPKLLGEKDSYLNSLRSQCKCYMWFDPQLYAIKIVGQEEQNVIQATARIRNWYLKCARRPASRTLRLLNQPSNNVDIKFGKLPPKFVTYKFTKEQQERFMLDNQCLMEPVSKGVVDTIRERCGDLIDLEDSKDQPAKPITTLSPRAQTLNERNLKSIQDALEVGLESLRLFDWEIRMKIRYGQICLVDYPKKSSDHFFTIEELSDKYFPKPQFRSVLAPCIGKTRTQMKPLFEYLTTHCEEFADSPRTSYSINAMQQPTFSLRPMRGESVPPPGEPWKTLLTARFRSDGQIGLWNCLTQCQDLVSISCAELEGNYSWEAKLEYGRRLPSESNTPHGRFAEQLRKGPENRLILVKVPDYEPLLVTQKTKWVYGWGEYIVEVGCDELWDLTRVEHNKAGLPLDLGQTEPHRTFYKVSIYKEAWRDRFAENLGLNIGEAPRWTPIDFLAAENEDVSVFMQMANTFGNILTQEVPLYWNTKDQSLV
ncbi:uncharacterized protein BYT42DRAFT_542000 [Radiomyces spectabilis]|uniref:uncharacterized protein n=1 Tax=Radiomyces spectabilis TaxID=64574 RepID=UPI00221F4D96|nr:uncharacterized protein BYT42DRAFT_542000 [Radiomyces spectabilis]KAI8393796.1 hypothetical protein BYT42DRAFT_542000 [Radiomyces spectabilis]